MDTNEEGSGTTAHTLADVERTVGHEVSREQLEVLASLVDQADRVCAAAGSDYVTYGVVVLQELLNCHQQNKNQRIANEWQVKMKNEGMLNQGMAGAMSPGYSRL